MREDVIGTVLAVVGSFLRFHLRLPEQLRARRNKRRLCEAAWDREVEGWMAGQQEIGRRQAYI